MANRFYVKDRQIFDGGIKISEDELLSFLQRQWRAMQNNSLQGPLGERANALLTPEYNQAHEIYKQLRPDLYKVQEN